MNIVKFGKLFNNSRKIDIKDLNGLANFDIFERLDKLEADILLRHSYKREYKSGEKIVLEGDASVGLYFIISGEASIVKYYKGKNMEIARVQKGAVFGELSILGVSKRTATVISVTNVEAYFIFVPDLMDILKENPNIFAKILPVLSANLIDKVSKMYYEIAKLKKENSENEW